MSPRMHLAAGIALAAFSTAALAARGLLGPALQQSTRCTDLTIEVWATSWSAVPSHAHVECDSCAVNMSRENL